MTKMSDSNSAMMQMVMQMIQNQKPSGNIIKAPQNANPQNIAPQSAPKTEAAAFAKTNLATQAFTVISEPAAKAATNSSKEPTIEQLQKARQLAQQFISQKNQSFTISELQEIENKILERLVNQN